MIKLLTRRWLRAFSARYQYDTGYMEEIMDHDLTVFLKYSTLNLLSTHRRGIPLAPWYAARIRAALWEDCGPCVQLVCNMALEAEVDPAVVAAIVAGDLEALDEDTALAVEFTELVLRRNPTADNLRQRIRRLWGEDGLISLAMTISTTRVYPGVKYVLGHGQVCSRVEVARHNVTPAALQSATIQQVPAQGLSR
jgi:hypothetical protein